VLSATLRTPISQLIRSFPRTHLVIITIIIARSICSFLHTHLIIITIIIARSICSFLHNNTGMQKAGINVLPEDGDGALCRKSVKVGSSRFCIIVHFIFSIIKCIPSRSVQSIMSCLTCPTNCIPSVWSKLSIRLALPFLPMYSLRTHGTINHGLY
jgi:hypothetical protein